MSDPARPLRSRFRLWLVAALFFIGAMVAVLWWANTSRSPEAPDLAAILHRNNQGIGLMEQFRYPEAAAVFAEITKLAPDWQPGHINHGIALFNSNEPDKIGQALQIFAEVLQREPDNLQARYCSGIILYHRGDLDQAEPHFRTVAEADPRDAHAWYFYGKTLSITSDEARHCFEKAFALNPYLGGVLQALERVYRLQGDKQADELIERFQKLAQADALNVIDIQYTKMGKYAEVIGRVPDTRDDRTGPLPVLHDAPRFQVQLPDGARWATDEDLGEDESADLHRAMRKRFGGTLAGLDYDQDGRPDVLLLSAVVENGQVRDLLLHNEGNGQFRDVTAEAGLADERTSLGCAVGDYDNDGWPDLVITGAERQWLFRNRAEGKTSRFEDVSSAAGLDGQKAVCLGPLWLDVDQDGDLDLLLARFADDVPLALKQLRSGSSPSRAALAVYLNAGSALPGKQPAEKIPPAPLSVNEARGVVAALETKFRAESAHWIKACKGAGVTLAAADFDEDRDIDVLLLASPQARWLLNDRLLNYRSQPVPPDLLPDVPWNGALVLDSNKDERFDLFLVSPVRSPLLLLNQPGNSGAKMSQSFRPGAVDAPPLRQAQVIDLDLDGWLDVAGISSEGRAVYLHNDGQRLAQVPEVLGTEPADLLGLLAVDVNDDNQPDVLLWSASRGLLLKENVGNGNHGLRLHLTGRRDRGDALRCNADGIGARVIVQAGSLWTDAENTTLSAGLGQGQLPLLFGLGQHTEADVVRLRWPDGIRQAELSIPANKTAAMRQTNRNVGSCPLLFTWNGQRYEFITDFLGGGTIGEAAPDGYRPPRPEESIKIEAHQLAPRAGQYTLKLAEPMDEVTYLDWVQLLVLDHPATVQVYPDERFTMSGPAPTQDLLAFRTADQIFPQARDHRGRNVTATLRHRDRNMVDGFASSAWLGFAEPHTLELDFGAALAELAPDTPLVLFLAGWTDYAFPEALWAASQAGVQLESPVLERRTETGRWEIVHADMGFPAGLPRMMTVDVTGKLQGSSVLRLRSNMQVYWDQVFLAPLLERLPLAQVQAGKQPHHFRVHPLEVDRASLEVRGCVQEYTPDGKKPTLYDYDRLAAIPVTRLAGKLTRLGDVTDLLHRYDDRFVIFGPGDDVTVQFRAVAKSPPADWSRSYVLRTWGYCKMHSLFTATGDSITPLPFRAMSNFPYPDGEQYPRTPEHQEYLRRWNTRSIGRR